MDDLAKVFIGGATLCFGIVAVAVGARIYQSETLVAVIVGGSMAVLVLAAVAVVLVIAVRLYQVRRESAELRLIIGRTVQALGGGAVDAGRPAVDPAVIAALLDAGAAGDDAAAAHRWREVERPRLEVDHEG